MNTNTITKIFFIILIYFSIYFLLNSTYLENFIWKSDVKFIDFKILISWLECNYLGFDVYSLNDIKNCPNFYSIIYYGDLWLLLPFNETLKDFYLDILPYIIIFLFVGVFVFLTSPTSFLDFSILVLAFLNPSTLLLIERLGFDIFIFLLIIFIGFNRIYFLNWITIFLLAFIKVYPAILGINIFLENIKRSIIKNIILILTLISISLVYFYFNIDKYMISIIKGASNSGKAGYHYLFSLNSLPKILKYIFEFNYIFSLLLIYCLFFILAKFFNKKFQNNIKLFNEEIFSKKGRLFLLSGYLSLFCFVFFSNFAYREILLLLLIPYLIQVKNNSHDIFLYFFISLIFFRFIYLYLYGFINVNDGIIYINGVRFFSNKFLIIITLKAIIDFFLMCFVSIIIYNGTIKFINYKKFT